MAPTLPTEQRSISYAGNGVTDTFPVPFEFREDEHLVVKLVLISRGLKTLQVLGVDYGVTGAGEQTGDVVFVAPPSALYTVSIERTVPITQDTDFRAEGTFDPNSHTRAHNHRTEVEQQLADRIAALEALGSLLDISGLEAVRVQVTFTTDVDAVEDTFAGGAVTAAIPADFVPSLVLVGKVAGGAGGQDAVMVRDWTLGDNLVLGFVTGLEPGTEYTLDLLLLSIAVT